MIIDSVIFDGNVKSAFNRTPLKEMVPVIPGSARKTLGFNHFSAQRPLLHDGSVHSRHYPNHHAMHLEQSHGLHMHVTLSPSKRNRNNENQQPEEQCDQKINDSVEKSEAVIPIRIDFGSMVQSASSSPKNETVLFHTIPIVLDLGHVQTMVRKERKEEIFCKEEPILVDDDGNSTEPSADLVELPPPKTPSPHCKKIANRLTKHESPRMLELKSSVPPIVVVDEFPIISNKVIFRICMRTRTL
jgi:hypothetical protein